jgi:serine/threonine-protein kinase RIO1
VHADFSEYNILLHEGELVVIDVSQAVEHAHPHALEFLRMDINNVNDFFGRKVRYVPRGTRGDHRAVALEPTSTCSRTATVEALTDQHSRIFTPPTPARLGSSRACPS